MSHSTWKEAQALLKCIFQALPAPPLSIPHPKRTNTLLKFLPLGGLCAPFWPMSSQSVLPAPNIERMDRCLQDFQGNIHSLSVFCGKTDIRLTIDMFPVHFQTGQVDLIPGCASLSVSSFPLEKSDLSMFRWGNGGTQHNVWHILGA